MLQVAVTGSHGTGKSALVESLAASLVRRGLRVNVLEEVPRKIVADIGDVHFLRRDNNTIPRQLVVLFKHLLEYSMLFRSDVDVLVSDRTLVDHWVYTMYLFPEELNDKAFDLWHRYLAAYTAGLDYIFYLPIEFLPIDDGVRDSDIEFQAEIDQMIVKAYTDAGISLVPITGTLEDRVAQVEQHIIGII